MQSNTPLQYAPVSLNGVRTGSSCGIDKVLGMIDRHVTVSHVAQLSVGRPLIGIDRASGLNETLDCRQQCLRTSVIHELDVAQFACRVV